MFYWTNFRIKQQKGKNSEKNSDILDKFQKKTTIRQKFSKNSVILDKIHKKTTLIVKY